MGVISKSSFERTEVIGRGKFGVVYKGYNKQTKQVVAIKVLNLDTEEDEVIDVQQEIQFLTELKNVPNVTHYYGSFLNDTRLWIVMDYCAGGSVRTILKCGVFEEKYIGVILRELLIALQAVHKLGFIHRDLKAANVLITKEGNVRLCDFGVATQITSNALKRTTMAGTPYWMAPEVIREGDTYNAKADIWSLGITIYEIATGNPPYCDKDAMRAMQMISKLTPPRLEGREYSSALKEIVALCLDENPEERPSAEDLLKCKFVRFYKSHPTVELKEVITRYLLWRDRDSSRDSVAYMNLEENIVPTHCSGNENEHDNDHQLQVKWDFDSLSSRDYIIENDIDMDQVEENYEDSYGYNEEDGTNDTYQTQATLQMANNNENTLHNPRSKFTNTLNNDSKYSTDRNNTTGSTPNSEIPKSLLQLFQEASPEMNAIPSNIGNQGFELPQSFTPSDQRLDSPTIEIPDMDNFGGYAEKPITQPSLNKPPALYHSQSASGNLETRHSTSASANRQRKPTISNTFGSNSCASHQPPRTPSSTTSSNLKTPSPKPAPASAHMNATGITDTVSPSKSMKALQSNSNPLLQPINFKLTNESNGSGANGSSNLGTANNNTHASVSANNIFNGAANGNSNASPSNGNGSVNSANNNQPSTMHVQATSAAKPKRPRPGFHIQMPTPSNSLNTLSALTQDFDLQNNSQATQNDNVNQFGINPSQIGNLPLTMTPVTEKEALVYPGAVNTTDSEVTNPSSNPRHHGIQVKKTNNSAAGSTASLPAIISLSTGNTFLPRTTSLNGTGPANANKDKVSTNFPQIPNINGDFFLDTTSKYKLINELDVMIKLFNQGLETLENDI